MSWPTDELPRFTAASVPAPGAGRQGDRRAYGYVYDRGRCFWPVAVLRHKIEGIALRDAEASAAVLNAGGDLTPEQRGERPHNRRRYQTEGCRCSECRAAAAAYNRKRRAERRAAA